MYTTEDEAVSWFTSTANSPFTFSEERTYVVYKKYGEFASSIFCINLGEILVNLTDILLLTVEVNVDFVIDGLKCHKDDKHEVKGLDTEVSKHTNVIELFIH